MKVIKYLEIILLRFGYLISTNKEKKIIICVEYTLWYTPFQYGLLSTWLWDNVGNIIPNFDVGSVGSNRYNLLNLTITHERVSYDTTWTPLGLKLSYNWTHLNYFLIRLGPLGIDHQWIAAAMVTPRHGLPWTSCPHPLELALKINFNKKIYNYCLLI